MKSNTRKGAFWEDAPNFLLGKIVELSSVLSKYQNGDNQEALAFYKGVLDAMRLSYLYMQDTIHIHRRNAVLQVNLNYLAEYNQQIEAQIDEIRTVSKLQSEGRLKEVLEDSARYVDAVVSLRGKYESH